MHVTIFLGCSLDGFIARPDGSVDFLDLVDPPSSDMGFEALLARVDVLVMGRNTFDFLIDSGFDWAYGDLAVRVATTRELVVPDELVESVSVSAVSGSPAELVDLLQAEGFTSAYIDGGKLGADFLAAGLVDQLTLTFVPITIGSGIRPFAELAQDRRWRHQETVSDPSGFVQVTWVQA